eukprot:1159065-Pelagomonas_calceolata.AAC.7
MGAPSEKKLWVPFWGAVEGVSAFAPGTSLASAVQCPDLERTNLEACEGSIGSAPMMLGPKQEANARGGRAL